jgi:hypothetical protein
LLALVSCVFFVAACDSGGSNEAQNEFSLKVKEPSAKAFSNRTLNGYSFFVDTQDIDEANEQAFGIYFNGNNSFSADSPPEGLFGVIGREGSQPGTGSYQLANGTGQVAPTDLRGFLYEAVQDQESLPYYVIIGGTLDLSTSTDATVAGDLDAEAIAYTIAGSGQNLTVNRDTVTVTGQFSAKSVDSYLPIGNYSP